MKKQIITTLFIVFSIAQTFGSSYYWVGGTGMWNDLTHWASSSGGAGSAYVQVPTSNDDVFFNASSFTGNAQTVTISLASVCRHFNWTGSTNTYTGANAPTFILSNSLDIYGDLTFPVSVLRYINMGSGTLRFSGSTTQSFNPGSTQFSSGTVEFANNGIVNFSSNMSLYTTNNTDLLFTSGTLNFNNYTINARSFTSTGSATRTLNMGNAILNLGYSGNTSWNLNGATNITLNAGNSKINISTSGNTTNFYGGGKTYNILQNTTISTLNIYSTGTVIDSLMAVGPVYMQNAVSFTGTLTASPGIEVLFAYGLTYTFGSSCTFVINGTCARPNSLRGWYPGATTILTKTGGWGTQNFSYCQISGISFTGGGTISATNSVDLGDNTGITITGSGNKKYWIGNGGNWADATHWATSSGGATCGCIPMASDSVYFDANSFSSAAQNVSIDTFSAYCRNMTWTGVTNTPTLNNTFGNASQATTKLFITGSLKLVSGMNWNLPNIQTYFASTGNDTITTTSKALGNNIYIVGSGTYTLGDSLNLSGGASNYTFYLSRGTFYTNGKGIYAKAFSSNANLTRNIYLGSSNINLDSKAGGGATSIVDINGTLYLNPGTSTFYLNNSTGAGVLTLNGDAKRFNNVYFTNSAVVATVNQADTFRILSFAYDANLTDNFQIQDSIVFTSGSTYTFTNGKTLTLMYSAGVSDATIKFHGSSCSQYTFTSFVSNSSSAVAKIAKNGGTAITLNYVALQYMQNTGSTTINCNNSLNVVGSSGFTITAPTGRNLYWIGGTGNWSDQNHWALTSGGTGGNCLPSLIDNVYFDANSFTSISKTVTVDVVETQCKRMDWTGATNTPTFSFTATGNLKIYGTLVLIPAMTFTLGTNTVAYFLGFDSTTYTITSGGRSFYNVTVDCKGGGYSLVDSMNLIAGNGYALTLTSGTFTTNNNKVSCNNLVSSGALTRAMNLGSSLINLNTTSSGTLVNFSGSNFTFNAGTSRILYASGSNTLTFAGGGYTFWNVEFNTTQSVNVNGNNTFNDLKVTNLNNLTVNGNNTINDSLILCPGKTHLFANGTTTTFAANCTIKMIGTGALPIYLRSTLISSPFTWTKPSGFVCADFIYIRDNTATGGATYTGGGNANDQGGNTNWDFSPYPSAANGNITGGTKCRNTAFSMPINITAGTYPINAVIRNVTTNKLDTVFGITYTPYYYSASPSVTSTYRLEQLIVNRCFGGITYLSVLDTVTVPNYSSYTPGKWVGRNSADWFSCGNWEDYQVPNDTVNVTINSGAYPMPIINAAGAMCKNLTINMGASLRMSTMASTLTMYGDMNNTGTFTADSGTVTLRGSVAQNIGNSTFNNLTVNTIGTASINLTNNITVNKVLTLTNGKITTNSYKVIVADSSTTALSGGSDTSYIDGTLRRNIYSNTLTYSFPIGKGSLHTGVDIKNNTMVGVNYIDAKFISKPGNDKGLSAYEYGTNFDTIIGPGVWVLTPNNQPSSGTYDLKCYTNAFSGLMDNRFSLLTRADTSTTASAWSIGDGTLNSMNGLGRKVNDGYALRKANGHFSQKGLGMNLGNALPVKLTTLTATPTQHKSIKVEWVTATEINNRGFEVQRSEDGVNFEKIGWINGNGNSSLEHDYSYDDQNVQQGTNYYYRLNQVDRDGKTELSTIVNAKLNGTNPTSLNWMQFLPNPADKQTNLVFNSNTEGETLFRLFDANGILMFQQKYYLTNGVNNFDLSTKNFAPGIYFAEVVLAGETVKKSLVVGR